jgi:glycerophosphoryl diester phosphodiesterase
MHNAPSFLSGGPALAAARRPLLLGHRGASADFPENTLAAFRAALEQGADGVELDVMRCASGEVVVVHDDDLVRVTAHADGSRRPVRASTLDELRRFDVGRGERVPTLDEVLGALGREAFVNVELKSPETQGPRQHLTLLHDDGLALETAAVLERHGRTRSRGARRTLVSSFDPLQLVRFHRCAGDAVPLGYLFHRDQHPLAHELYRVLPVRAVHPEAGLIDAAALARWRRRGLGVNTWTVDDPREIATLVVLGVDAVITNRPGAVRAQLEAMLPGSA